MNVNINWNFDNSYSKLPESFKENINPIKVKNPELIILNKSLASDLDLDFSNINKIELSTLFAGNSTTEPIALKAKFTNLSSNVISNSENIPPPKSIVVDSENLTQFTEPDNSTMEISNNDRITNFNDISDSDFEIGLIMGIIVGVAIGISMFFIIRQKNT